MAAFEAWFALDLCNLFQLTLDPLKYSHTKLLVRHFATTEAQGNLHLIAVVEETFDGPHLDVVVVLINRRTHLDLLDLDGLLLFACFGGFFLLLELELAVVHDLADRRLSIRRNLNEIQAGVIGAILRLEAVYHPDIFSVLINQTDFSDPNGVVDFRACIFALGRCSVWAADGWSPLDASKKFLCQLTAWGAHLNPMKAIVTRQ
ncbi:protein of unknown function [Candidatus Filomicrobium marinum]|uniref:Uncharacterized protein n=1 Tax=Candidatus Filomicrobium marinum TaxID=1608628 RepID=A0A0D6JDT0_9HYPH|nr:protein of unknown function [Candidatus Filomicrobium marinum]CPR18140.1 protein of unknown function [Candidatus Filomicrobium marinum]